jgi:hypothetical protein
LTGKGKTNVNVRFIRSRRGWESRLTYEDGADERMVQDPPDGYIGDARAAVAVADSP